MIQTKTDLNSAIKFVTTENESYPSILENKMSSSQFNNSMRIIETQLNELYEKIRLLEDINNYCKNYILSIIQTKELQFKEKLKIIEDITDQYRDTESISYNVPFTYNNQSIIKDRDGSIINHMYINDTTLEQSSMILDTAKISNISYESNAQCYNNNYNNILLNEAGRSFYCLNEAIYGGIVEKCTIMFDKDYNCNTICIIPSNAQIRNCKLITDKDLEIDVNYIDSFNLTNIKGLKFELVCNNYIIKDRQEMENTIDSYNVLNNNVYKRNQNITKNIINDCEKINNSYNISEFLNNYYEWADDVQNVSNKNIVVSQKKG